MINVTSDVGRRTLDAQKTLLGLLAMAMLLLPAWGQAKVQMLDRIVAVVNDGAIMASELDERINTIALPIPGKGPAITAPGGDARTGARPHDPGAPATATGRTGGHQGG